MSSPTTDMLGLQGVPATTHGRIRTARILAAALTDPACRLEIGALCDHTGLSRPEVLEVLTSEDWQDALRGQLLSLAGAGLMALVDVLRQIATDEDRKDSDRIAAIGKLHTIWKDSAAISAASSAVADEETAAAFLKTVKPMKLKILPEEHPCKPATST